MGKPKTPRFLAVTRNHGLWLLKHEVNDERFLQIFADFAGLIRRSERACEKAQAQGIPDYADYVVDSECDYLEEYEFFGIDPYSNCRQLAVQVQDWAKAVYAAA